MTVPIRTSTHHDPLRAQQLRRVAGRWVMGGIGIVVLLGGLAWVMWFSPILRVSHIQIQDLEGPIADSLRTVVADIQGRNLLLIHADDLQALVASELPVLASVSVQKRYPHTLTIAAVQRIPVGLWCKGEACQYVDSSGTRWGTAPRSRGALLLLVDDQRTTDTSSGRITTALLTLAAHLQRIGLRMIWATLPGEAPGSVIAYLGAYELYIDALGDVADQLATLEVFLSSHSKDPAFAPKYLDLRTPGRVYFQ